LEDGGFLVVWSTVSAIFAQRYTGAGQPVGPRLRVTPETSRIKVSPAIAALRNGGFVIVWEAQEGPSYGVYGQRFNASGKPVGAQFRANTTQPGYQGAASASAFGNGFVVVWESEGQDGSGKSIYAQRYNGVG